LSVAIQLIPNHSKKEVNSTVILPLLIFPVQVLANIRLGSEGLPGTNNQAMEKLNPTEQNLGQCSTLDVGVLDNTMQLHL
jgi:hypothetical protein